MFSNKCQQNILGALCFLWYSKSYAIKLLLQSGKFIVVSIVIFPYNETYSLGSNVRSSASLREIIAVSMTLGFNASLNLINDA